MESFTDQMWAGIAGDIYPGIIAHPFVRGLTSGALDEAAFRHYVREDSTYLEAYGRGLALLAAKSDTPESFLMFCEHARTTVIVEEALHREFLQAWGGDAGQPPRWDRMSPNGLLYTSYLLRVAYERPFHEALAAFLPCYWIYRRVGQHLVKQGSPNPLYQRWIDTYAGEEFGAVVREILELTNRVAAPLTAGQQARMLAHFRRTSELEYLFWDAAHKRQQWPFAASDPCGTMPE
jgi:thiaminase/transcriptional activator TenA